MAKRRYTHWLDEEDILFLQTAYPKGHSKILRMLIQRHKAKVDQRTQELLKNVASSPVESINLESLGVTDAAVGTDTGDIGR